jgi:hypothetical protein
VFKSVEYAGFDGRPDLKAKAERATAALAGEIRRWRDEVRVAWRPAAPNSGADLEVTLALALTTAGGSATGLIQAWAFEPGEEGGLRSALRSVWSDLLALLSDQQMKRLDDFLREPVEA